MQSDVKYVYIEDCYCDVLHYTKGRKYEVIDSVGEYYRIKSTIYTGGFIIYKKWCIDATTKFEFPEGLFEI